MRAALVVAALAACTDPVIDMQVVVSPQLAMTDASCVTAVEVHATGKDYPKDPMNFTSKCLHLSGATYADIQNQMHNSYSISLPPSGLGGIEIFGWSNPVGSPDPCEPQPTPYTTPDLTFFSTAAYTGQSLIELPLQPNVGCTATEIKVRMVDLFALSSGTTPSSASCATAEIPDSMNASVGLGSLIPKLAGTGADFFGDITGAGLSGGIADFIGLTQINSNGCIALTGGDDSGGSTSCVVGGTPVCAGTGETELGYVRDALATQLLTQDQQLIQRWHGQVFGAVWSGGATKHPIAGATVTIDPAHGVVEYIDPPVGTGPITMRTDNATGTSGLFVVYTDTVASVTVDGAGLSRPVTMGSPDDYQAAMLIVLQ